MNFGSNTNIGSAKFIPYLYDRIKSIIESFSNNSVISSDKDNVLIPTDADGNNAVYTNSAVNFLVFYGGINQTSSWTISVLTQSNVTTSQVGNAVSITNIAADTGYYVVRAIRTDYTTITKKITVFKAKRGATGATGPQGIQGVPGGDIIDQYDNETIILDGASKLKVRDLEYYNSGTVTNVATIKGNVNTSLSSNSNRIVFVGTNPTEEIAVIGATDCLIIGEASNIAQPGGGAINKSICIGENVDIYNYGATALTNVINIGSNSTSYRAASYTVNLGTGISNMIPYSTSISHENSDGANPWTYNNTIFYRVTSLSSGDGDLVINIPVTTATSNGLVKIDLDLIGKGENLATFNHGVYKAKKSLTFVNGTKVLDVDDASETYSTSPLLGCTYDVASTYSGGNIVITVHVVTSTGSTYSHWVANCKIDILA